MSWFSILCVISAVLGVSAVRTSPMLTAETQSTQSLRREENFKLRHRVSPGSRLHEGLSGSTVNDVTGCTSQGVALQFFAPPGLVLSDSVT